MDESIHPVTSTVIGESTKDVDDRALDEAAKYLANHEEFGPMTPEQEKKIVKKIDSWMIPLVSPNSRNLRRYSSMQNATSPEIRQF